MGEYPGLISEAQCSPVSRHCNKYYSAAFGVTGLNTNVLAKLKRKRKYGNIHRQKTLPPLTFSSAEQWLSESSELEGGVDLFPFPLLTSVSCR